MVLVAGSSVVLVETYKGVVELPGVVSELLGAMAISDVVEGISVVDTLSEVEGLSEIVELSEVTAIASCVVTEVANCSVVVILVVELLVGCSSTVVLVTVLSVLVTELSGVLVMLSSVDVPVRGCCSSTVLVVSCSTGASLVVVWLGTISVVVASLVRLFTVVLTAVVKLSVVERSEVVIGASSPVLVGVTSLEVMVELSDVIGTISSGNWFGVVLSAVLDVELADMMPVPSSIVSDVVLATEVMEGLSGVVGGTSD